MCTLATDAKTLEGAQQTVGWVTPVVMIFSRLGCGPESRIFSMGSRIYRVHPQDGGMLPIGVSKPSPGAREKEKT